MFAKGVTATTNKGGSVGFRNLGLRVQGEGSGFDHFCRNMLTTNMLVTETVALIIVFTVDIKTVIARAFLVHPQGLYVRQ